MNKRQLVLGAAIAGLLAAGTTLKPSVSFGHDEAEAAGDKNSCKGKDAAKADKNSCKGKEAAKKDKNSCKGKNACSGEEKEASKE